MISSERLNILVCPVCRGKLHADEGLQSICCRSCGLAFPVRDGIPVMLAGEAKRLP